MKGDVASSSLLLLQPLLLTMSVGLLLRGNVAPGGGFAGGLIAAGALALPYIIEAPDLETRQRASVERWLLSAGLGLVVVAATLPMVLGQPILSNVKGPDWGLGLIHLETMLLFEIGIYLVTCGASILVLQVALRKYE